MSRAYGYPWIYSGPPRCNTQISTRGVLSALQGIVRNTTSFFQAHRNVTRMQSNEQLAAVVTKRTHSGSSVETHIDICDLLVVDRPSLKPRRQLSIFYRRQNGNPGARRAARPPLHLMARPWSRRRWSGCRAHGGRYNQITLA